MGIAEGGVRIAEWGEPFKGHVQRVRLLRIGSYRMLRRPWPISLAVARTLSNSSGKSSWPAAQSRRESPCVHSTWTKPRVLVVTAAIGRGKAKVPKARDYESSGTDPIRQSAVSEGVTAKTGYRGRAASGGPTGALLAAHLADELHGSVVFLHADRLLPARIGADKVHGCRRQDGKRLSEVVLLALAG